MHELVKKLHARNDDFVYLLDPVMGDMERGIYVNPDVVPIYRNMLSLATIICPNQFEAQILADKEITSLASLEAVLTKLHVEHGVQHVLITSLTLPENDLDAIGASKKMPDGSPAMLLVGSSWANASTGGHLQPWFIQFPQLGDYFVGVGDLFAALTLARFAETFDQLPAAARQAAAPLLAEEESECDLPIARAVAFAVASLQSVLVRTQKAMEATAQTEDIDPFMSTVHCSLEENVKVMRMRELRIVQSALDILRPTVLHRPRWMHNAAS